MKCLRLALVSTLLVITTSLFGQDPLTYTSTFRYNTPIPGTNCNGFHESLPKGYNDDPQGKFPVILYLAGNSQRGNGQQAPDPLNAHGYLEYVAFDRPTRYLKEHSFPEEFIVNGQTYRFIVITPQFSLTEFTNIEQIEACYQYVVSHYKVDIDRFYIIGNSYGGAYLWDYLGDNSSNPAKIAAAVNVAGASLPNDTKCAFMANAMLPLIACHNTNDNVVQYSWSQQYVNRVNFFMPVGAEQASLMGFTPPVAQHDATWMSLDLNPSLYGSYATQLDGKVNVYEWLLQFRRFLNPLPVQFASFNAIKLNYKSQLNWSTANETNSRGFEILRSSDGNSWNVLHFENSASTGGHGQYDFTDNNPLTGKNYYRIRQLDLNNTKKLSEIRIVDFGKNEFVNLYPNPAVNMLYLITDINFNKTAAKIFNSQGQLVSTILLNGSGTISIPVSQLKPGTYFFQIQHSAGNSKLKFVKK